MPSPHVLRIELINPEHVLPIKSRRAICLNADEDIIIRLETLPVAKALRDAVRDKVWQLRDIADSPRNAKSLRRSLSNAPTAFLRRLTMGNQRETHIGLELDLSTADDIKTGDAGQLLSVDSSEYGHTMLAIRNIPAGLALLGAIESIVWEFENDPYGSKSAYAKEQRRRQQEIQDFYSDLRKRLYRGTGNDNFVNEQVDLVEQIRIVIAEGTPAEIATVKEIVRGAARLMKSPPTWTDEVVRT